jgi:hypothetical protein
MRSKSDRGVPVRRRSTHRETLAEYIAAQRHLIDEGDGDHGGERGLKAKPLKQVARETGMSIWTVRHWVQKDHRREWLRYWPAFNDILAETSLASAATAKRPRVTMDLPAITMVGDEVDSTDLCSSLV